MAVFLLFDSGARLVATQETGVNYATVPPLSIFGKEEGEGFSAHEVHPKVLERIRPPVWPQLTLHGVKVIGFGERGGQVALQLDDFETINRRLQRQAITTMETRLVDVAGELGVLKLATQELAFTPPSAEKRHFFLSKTLKQHLEDLHKWESGHYKAQVPQVLVDWAGKVIPL